MNSPSPISSDKSRTAWKPLGYFLSRCLSETLAMKSDYKLLNGLLAALRGAKNVTILQRLIVTLLILAPQVCAVQVEANSVR